MLRGWVSRRVGLEDLECWKCVVGAGCLGWFNASNITGRYCILAGCIHLMWETPAIASRNSAALTFRLEVAGPTPQNAKPRTGPKPDPEPRGNWSDQLAFSW